MKIVYCQDINQSSNDFCFNLESVDCISPLYKDNKNKGAFRFYILFSSGITVHFPSDMEVSTPFYLQDENQIKDIVSFHDSLIEKYQLLNKSL